MTEFGQATCLDLTDPFPGGVDHLAHIRESPWLVPVETKPEPQHLLLLVIQIAECLDETITPPRRRGPVFGVFGIVVLDEILKGGVAVLADRSVEGDRFRRCLQGSQNPVLFETRGLGNLLEGWGGTGREEPAWCRGRCARRRPCGRVDGWCGRCCRARG